MFTRLRRYLMSYFDAELAAAVGELAEMQRRLGDVESRQAQEAAALRAGRDAALREVGQLGAELAEVRHELEKTAKALGVAEEENRRLWAVCQRDHARVAKERALLDRARAEAETVASLRDADG